MRFRLLCIAALVAGSLTGQTPEDDWGNLSEFLVDPSTGQTADLQQWMDRLEVLRSQPIPINTASLEELQQIPFLDVFEAFSVIEHRRKFGYFLSAYDLMAVEGLPTDKARMLAKILDFSPPARTGFPGAHAWNNARHRIILRGSGLAETPKGFTGQQPAYPGLPAALYGRYLFQIDRRISMGFTMENDAGEPYRKEGPDFFSAHAFYRNKGRIRAVALGDFHANFGQGLVLYSYPSFGKSSQQGRVMRAEEALQPFTGRNEFSFLRGAGVSLGWEDVEWTILASRRNLDARVDTFSNAFDLQTDGLHRTETERARKNQYQWTAVASRATYTQPGSFQLGASIVANQGSGFIGITPEAYERYRTFPEQWVNAGLDVKYRFNRMAVFGEVAASSNGGWSGVGGLEAQPAPGWIFSMVARNLGLEYRALMMNPFSNSAQPGEKGLFFGLQGTFPKGWSVSGFADFYQYSWLRFRTDAPAPGSDFMLQPEYNPNRETKFYLRLRYRDGLENEAGTSNGVPGLERVESTSIRGHLSHQATPRLTLASRAEITFFQRGPTFSQGWMVFQEATYNAARVRISGRIALVNIDDYDNRMYAYERDLPYLFSVPAYFGKGIRWYLLASWKVNAHAEIGFRIARWTRPGADSQGSGNDETTGKHRTDVRAQVLLTL